MRIALNQCESSLNVEENIQQFCKDIETAAEQGVDLMVLPEAALSPFGGRLHPSLEIPIFRDCARHYGVSIIYGAFRPAHDGRLHNTLVAITPQETVTYDKIHLYDSYGYKESRSVMPGSRPVLLEIGDMIVGLTTCYDIRFPELYVHLGQLGADMIVCSASWADGPGKANQWDTLVQARALDSTTYVVAVDQARPSEKRKGPTGIGRSAAISPDGEVLLRMGEEPGIGLVDLSVDRLVSVRNQLPVLNNRRL
ncbi:MAG: carbon-nitrogen hydrolase family protein [Corynebacterium sp.]|nr:carbon-nitrogen hydrolase family protein [Corynebacterium sp.]